MRIDLKAQIVREGFLEVGRIDRELSEVRCVDRGIREGVVEINRRKGCAKAELRGVIDLPEVFGPKAVEVIRIGLIPAKRQDVVAIGRNIEQLMCI